MSEFYVYNAALYCEECGKAIRRRLKKEGKAPADPRDERSYDSGEYPKGPYSAEESDVPEHCDACHVFLENPLTTAGVRYVIEEHREHPTETSEMWVGFYAEEIEYYWEGMMRDLDPFTRQYIETALWSSDNDNDEPLDESYGIEDIDSATLEVMMTDCKKFREAHWGLIFDDPEQAGHDFWLTRNGHGSGFWDGDWDFAVELEGKAGEPPVHVENVGERLTAAAKAFGEYHLMVGDDGLIFGYSG